jgi:hypothetical protein
VFIIIIIIIIIIIANQPSNGENKEVCSLQSATLFIPVPAFRCFHSVVLCCLMGYIELSFKGKAV